MIPMVLADTGLPVDVGETLVYQMSNENRLEGNHSIWNENTSTTLGETTISLTLGDTQGNVRFSAGPSPMYPSWQNWTIFCNNTRYEYSFTDPEDVEREESEPIWLREEILFLKFMLTFTGNLPITETVENMERFPILMDESNWETFSEDGQTALQYFISKADFYNDSLSAVADANSISIDRISSDGNITESFYIRYSADGICDEYNYSKISVVVNANSDYISTNLMTFTRIDSTIPSFHLTWFGIMVAGSIVCLVNIFRRKRR
jgi:hypothetical protein